MFKKGEVSNPKGRPLGSKNKAPSQVRSTIAMIVQSNLAQFQNDLMQLDPKERVDAIIKLLRYVAPTLTSVQFDTEDTGSAMTHLQMLSATWNTDKTHEAKQAE